MFKGVSKKNIILSVIFLVLVAILLFFILRGKNIIVPTSSQELNQDQKVSIVQALNVNNEANPVSLQEKNKIINEIKKEDAKMKPLTDEEKAAIMKALSN